MENIKKSLEFWLNQLEEYENPRYEAMPDIELYMEQVLTYLDKQLKIYSISSLDKQLTNSMINNYVKASVVDMPFNKKYSKIQLAKLLEIGTLKNTFSIPDIKQMLDTQYANVENSTAYNSFLETNSSAINKSCEETKELLNTIEDNDVEALTELSVRLACEAAIKAKISERILHYIKIKTSLEDN